MWQTIIVIIVTCFSSNSNQSTCLCTGPHTDWQPCFFECNNSSSSTTTTTTTKNVQILLFNGINDDVGFIYRNEALVGCASSRCSFIARSSTTQSVDTFDAVLFSLLYLEASHLPSSKSTQKQQHWIAHCGESRLNYLGRHLRNNNFMNRFDINITTERQSTIPFNYLSLDLFGAETWNRFSSSQHRVVEKQANNAPVVWFATNCNSQNKREKFVERMMKRIKIDSFGSCLRNVPSNIIAPDRRSKRWQQEKIELISKYKFVLAFENSNYENYVTEKFYHAFLAGVVPIFMGATNVDEFAPGNHSYINVNSFESPEVLADYIALLDNDAQLYNQYHAWRTHGELRPSFIDLLSRSMNTIPCRLCQHLHAQQQQQQQQQSFTHQEDEL